MSYSNEDILVLEEQIKNLGETYQDRFKELLELFQTQQHELRDNTRFDTGQFFSCDDARIGFYNFDLSGPISDSEPNIELHSKGVAADVAFYMGSTLPVGKTYSLGDGDTNSFVVVYNKENEQNALFAAINVETVEGLVERLS